MLKEESKELLKEFGWYEGRKINIDEIINICEKEGFEVFEEAKKIFEEFGGLILEEPTGAQLEHRFDIIQLSSRLGYNGVLSEGLTELLREKVLQIGIIYSGQYFIYVSESGKIYTDVGFLANDIYDAINYLLETLTKEEKEEKGIFKLWKDIGIDISVCYTV